MYISNSELFYQKTGRDFLYNIMPINNTSSVIEHGILCFELANRFNHTSIALNSVQERRAAVDVPGGLNLHQYANLYFDARNPMMYLRRKDAEQLCVFAITRNVLDIDGCIVTDRNASTEIVRFSSPTVGIETIEFDKVFSRVWVHNDQFERQNHKAIKCAEVLIPYRIDYSLIIKAFVCENESMQKMKKIGFEKEIIVDRDIFFR